MITIALHLFILLFLCFAIWFINKNSNNFFDNNDISKNKSDMSNRNLLSKIIHGKNNTKSLQEEEDQSTYQDNLSDWLKQKSKHIYSVDSEESSRIRDLPLND